MYYNKDKDKYYPNMINDIDNDIDCEKLFDFCFSIENGNIVNKNISETTYLRNMRKEYILNLENNRNFCNNGGMVSSLKFSKYYTNILVNKLSKSVSNNKRINWDKEYQYAFNILMKRSKQNEHSKKDYNNLSRQAHKYSSPYERTSK